MMAPTEQTSPCARTTIDTCYVASKCRCATYADLRDGLGRRGSAPPSDRVVIGFDTAHDHQNAYVFEVNASGVQNDYLQVDDTRTNNDYEAVWEVATLQTATGWNAEFGIPVLADALSRRRRAIGQVGFQHPPRRVRARRAGLVDCRGPVARKARSRASAI